MLFKEKLRYLRKINNMSQEELAGRLTVSRQAVSRWETGDTIPDAEILLQLSEVFEVSIDNLLKDNLEIDDKWNSSVPEQKNSALHKIVGICVVSFSMVVLICLGVLSSVFPVYSSKSINGGTDVLYKANIFTFLSKHNLTWLFIVLIVVLLLGIVLIFLNKSKKVKIFKHIQKK